MQASAGNVFAGLSMGVPLPTDTSDVCAHVRINAAIRGETHEADRGRRLGTSGGGPNLQVAWSDCCDEVFR